MEVSEDGNRPVDPVIIKRMEVITNPFDDIIPRNLSEVKAQQGLDFDSNKQSDDKKAEKKKSKIKGTKDKKLLSFEDGDDEVNDGDDIIKGMHSSHDSKFKNKKLSSKTDKNLLNIKKSNHRDQNNPHSVSSIEKRLDDERKLTNNSVNKREKVNKKESKVDIAEDEVDSMISTKYTDTDFQNIINTADAKDKKAKLAERKNEYFALQKELLRSEKAVKILTGAEALQAKDVIADKELLGPLQERRLKYVKKRSALGAR